LSPDWQVILDIVLSAILASLGWFARQIWEMIATLKDDLTKIEVSLPTNYVRRVDFESRFDKIDKALDKIFTKLDGKADK